MWRFSEYGQCSEPNPRGFKQGIADGLRSRTDRRRATEVDVVVPALNRMLLVWTARGGIGCARLRSVLIPGKADRPWTR